MKLLCSSWLIKLGRSKRVHTSSLDTEVLRLCYFLFVLIFFSFLFYTCMANWYHIVPLVPLPQKNCFPVSSFTTSYFQDNSSVHLVSLIEFCNQKCYGGNHHPGYFALDNIAFTSACNSHRLCWVTNAWRILLPTHSLHFSCLLDFFFSLCPVVCYCEQNNMVASCVLICIIKLHHFWNLLSTSMVKYRVTE